MNKTEMIYEIANKAGITKKQAEVAFLAFTGAIETGLANGEAVRISDFGTFEVSMRSARTGRNPQTGEIMEIPASKSVKFKAAKKLKDRVK